MKLYLAGPMRGYPQFNFPAFFAAAKDLRARGHEVWSPAENDVDVDGFDPTTDAAKPMRHYMLRDLPAVLNSDAVALLPGWRKSTGALMEVYVATGCGIPILDAATLEPIVETVCIEANRLVYGDRGETYGHPFDDFSKTAALWSVILGTTVTAEQVSMCMILLKLSRQMYQPKRDNQVDIAGYAECLQRCVDERARRAAA
jgi:hypothetical protein